LSPSQVLLQGIAPWSKAEAVEGAIAMQFTATITTVMPKKNTFFMDLKGYL